MPSIWVGFWVHNSLDKGSSFGRFSLNMGGLSRNRQKMVKIGTRIHDKSGYDGNCR